MALRAHRELPTAPRRAHRGGEHRVAEVPADGRRAGGTHREHVSRGGARRGRDRREAAGRRHQRAAGAGQIVRAERLRRASPPRPPRPRPACCTPAGRSTAVRPDRCARGGRPRETQPAAPGSRAPPRNRGGSPGRTSRRARGARRRENPYQRRAHRPHDGRRAGSTAPARHGCVRYPGQPGGGHGHRHGRDDEHHRDRDHGALARRGAGELRFAQPQAEGRAAAPTRRAGRPRCSRAPCSSSPRGRASTAGSPRARGERNTRPTRLCLYTGPPNRRPYGVSIGRHLGLPHGVCICALYMLPQVEEVVRTPEERTEGLPDFPFAAHYREVEGLRLAHLDQGEGAPVVFMHGEPTWSFLWRKVIPPVRDAGFRCVAADMVGFGRSDKPTDVGVVLLRPPLRVGGDAAGGTRPAGGDGGGARLGWTDRTASRRRAPQERIERIVILDTGLFTGKQAVTEDVDGVQETSRRAPKTCRSASSYGASCKNDPGDEVVAAYEAPYPNAASKAGARAFPALIPFEARRPRRGGGPEHAATRCARTGAPR